MIDENQIVEVKISKSNYKKYNLDSYNENIYIPFKDVIYKSCIRVKVICDYCGSEYEATYGNIINGQKNIQKHACKKCGHKKLMESQIKIYGDVYSNTKEGRERIKQSNLEKYGVEWPFQDPNSGPRLQRDQTNLLKYGSTSPFSSKQVQEKSHQTLYQNYKVTNPSYSDQIINKKNDTYYKHNTQKCSKQQLYIQKRIGGELNYPCRRYSIDIAFPEEGIAVEYDGGGHNLGVKLGTVSEYEFTRNENFRRKQLFEENWKIVNIISPTNKYPENISQIFDCIKRYLVLYDKHWLKYYVEENRVESTLFSCDINIFMQNINDGERLNEKAPVNQDDAIV